MFEWIYGKIIYYVLKNEIKKILVFSVCVMVI